MTRIRASCPVCGEVDLRPDDVVLRVVRTDTGLVGEGSCYRFCCPDCDELVTKPADERIAQLLSTGGVPIETAEAPEPFEHTDPRPLHPEFPPSGAPFTKDDLLDLHLKLDTQGWFDELLAGTPIS